MARYFIKFAYNGKRFHGWQIQPNANTVQAEMQKALAILLRQETPLMGAGRTDTGVHAKEMFAHFEGVDSLDVSDLNYRLNRLIPNEIAVQQIFKVAEDDHARFSATARTYEYLLVLEKDPFLQDLAFKPIQNPDFKKMNDACKILFDFTDFSCFSKSNTQTKTNNCKISKAHWEQKNNIWVFTITADRFLRNMVRAIVGTLLEVGYGNLSLTDFKNVILSKNRGLAGESVPANGLYLTKVGYPENVEKLIIRNKSING